MNFTWKQLIRGFLLITGIYLIAVYVADPSDQFWRPLFAEGILGVYTFTNDFKGDKP